MSYSPRAAFDQRLLEVRDNLLRMGQLVDSAIDRSMTALKHQDQALARQVIHDDTVINDLRFRVEEECLALIATQQPAASDLRVIVASMNLVNDMERMGDHATGIAKTVLRMGNEPLLKPLIDLPRMADLCQQMVEAAMQAYVARDASAARAVAARDDRLDALYNQIFREILACILEDPATTTRGLYLLFSAHNLERIGDRVVNIAERIVFMTSGELRELNAGPQAPV